MGNRIRLVAAGGKLVPGAIEVRLGECVLGTYQPRAGWRRGTRFVRQRLAEIERIIEARHGGPCDTDDGEVYLEVALPHLVALPVDVFPGSPAVLWAWSQLPRLVDARGREWIEAREAELRARDEPILLKADTVAERLGVRDEERSRLKLRTIGAIDLPAAKRKAEIKAKARIRNRERMRRVRAKERLEAGPKAPSISSLKPWEAEGIGKSTWYARRARETVGQPACAHSSEAPNARTQSVRSSAA